MLAEEVIWVRHRRSSTANEKLLTTGGEELLHGCSIDIDTIAVPIPRLQPYLEISKQLARVSQPVARDDVVNRREKNLHNLPHVQKPFPQYPLDLEGHGEVKGSGPLLVRIPYAAGEQLMIVDRRRRRVNR